MYTIFLVYPDTARIYRPNRRIQYGISDILVIELRILRSKDPKKPTKDELYTRSLAIGNVFWIVEQLYILRAHTLSNVSEESERSSTPRSSHS